MSTRLTAFAVFAGAPQFTMALLRITDVGVSGASSDPDKSSCMPCKLLARARHASLLMCAGVLALAQPLSFGSRRALLKYKPLKRKAKVLSAKARAAAARAAVAKKLAAIKAAIAAKKAANAAKKAATVRAAIAAKKAAAAKLAAEVNLPFDCEAHPHGCESQSTAHGVMFNDRQAAAKRAAALAKAAAEARAKAAAARANAKANKRNKPPPSVALSQPPPPDMTEPTQ
jgi:hypothetical protein